MNCLKQINSENKYFKNFKKGDRLLNDIYTRLLSSSRLYHVLSTSRCKNKKVCTISIDTIKSSKLEISKVETLLKLYTWNIQNNSLKTTDNGTSYTFESMLNRHNIKVNYSIEVKTNSFSNPKFLKVIINIIYLDGLSY
ncbi:MAG: hypothetical protein ACRCVJ_03260 [Clostridium sp.]|uniref:hypothetical protein n=1 Tax=Clostridium sp. TaxID=1506 RepID=UPI003F39965B